MLADEDHRKSKSLKNDKFVTWETIEQLCGLSACEFVEGIIDFWSVFLDTLWPKTEIFALITKLVRFEMEEYAINKTLEC